MAPKETIFCEENKGESKFGRSPSHIEPLILFPPTLSTLSINDLPFEKELLKTNHCFTRFSGVIYTLMSSFIFTCATFSIKLLGVDLIDALLLRIVIQALSTFLFAQYKHYEFLPGTTAQLFLQILCCTTGAGSFFLYFVATRYVELPDVTTLSYTRVVWTMVLSMCIYRERPSIGVLIALPLTLLGVVFVAQPSFLFARAIPSIITVNSKLRLLGITLSIANALASATNVLSFRQLIITSKDIKPSVINFQYCLTVLISLIVYQLYRKFFLHNGLTLSYVLSWRYLLAAVICLLMILVNILVQKAIKREHPTIFTLLGSGDIIFALILQNIFTAKRSDLFAMLGSALVICSVVIIGLTKIINERREEQKLKLVDNEPIIKGGEENDTNC